MRHAEGVRQHGAKPLAYTFTLVQGWGAAPLARSTPTRSAARDTPKTFIESYRLFEHRFDASPCSLYTRRIMTDSLRKICVSTTLKYTQRVYVSLLIFICFHYIRVYV
ncbi:MAG: hypothetical protein NZ455_11240 [Bacteroidia bacterium]|nr:hypothetical protein [Bacteroidia bacterium]MDW8347123.1 hypothetical protein [Bacteroidia bacterium]